VAGLNETTRGPAGRVVCLLLPAVVRIDSIHLGLAQLAAPAASLVAWVASTVFHNLASRPEDLNLVLRRMRTTRAVLGGLFPQSPGRSYDGPLYTMLCSLQFLGHRAWFFYPSWNRIKQVGRDH
jgi:hypothetical protein